jgi:hydrogenase expression/formation protein HypC
MCLGLPGEVIKLDAVHSELPTAIVEFAGIRRRVCMACVPDAQPGEYVIVHAGIAISRIDAAEAQRVFAYLNEIGESDGWETGWDNNDRRAGSTVQPFNRSKSP